MRVLFISPYIPSPVRVRPYNWLKALTRLGHSVHLVALRPPEDRWAGVGELRDLCETVDIFELSRGRTLRNMLLAVPGRDPMQAAYSHQPDAERRLSSLARSGGFDVAHIEHLRGAVLAWPLWNVPRVFDAVDSIAHLFSQASRLAPRLSQRLAARLELARTRAYEGRAVIEFDRTAVTSEADAQALRASIPASYHSRITVIPNGVDLEYFRPSDLIADPCTILFSGKMSYHANAATALHLARDIMPLVWNELPDARLVIAGKDPPSFLQRLAQDRRVTVTGFVDDLRPFFQAATLLAAPLVYGAGIQNKVLEGMASGVPVVTTDQAARALAAVPGRDLLAAADTRTFADQVTLICRNPGLRGRLSRASRTYAEQHHDWTDMGRRLSRLYEAAQRDQRPSPQDPARPVASS